MRTGVIAEAGPRILYAGTPAFAVPALKLLISEGLPPVAVLTQPDRRAGRGRKVQSSPVKQAALTAGISVQQPVSLKGREVHRWLTELQLDLLIVVAYGLILPRDILQLPRLGCWNIHASLLPRWRGAAPIQRAIEAGDTESGICIMQMDEGLDTGPVLSRQAIALAVDETGGSLHDRLAELGAETLLRCVHRLLSGDELMAVAQGDTGISYAAKLDKATAELDWNQETAILERKVRAFNPWPVAWCDIAGERTRVWAARALSAQIHSNPGVIVAATTEGIDIATADGVLRLTQLQRPGGRPLRAAEYLNARQLPTCTITQQ